MDGDVGYEEGFEIQEFLEGEREGVNLIFADGESVSVVFWVSDQPHNRVQRFEEDVKEFQWSEKWFYLESGIASNISLDQINLNETSDECIYEPLLFLRGIKILNSWAIYNDEAGLMIDELIESPSNFMRHDLLIGSALVETESLFNMVSASAFVRNGLEIKFSKRDSALYKNCQEFFQIQTNSTGWFIFAWAGPDDHFELKLSVPVSTQKIIRKFRKERGSYEICEEVGRKIERQRDHTVEENETAWVLDSGLTPGHIITTKTGLFNTREWPHMKNIVEDCELIGDVQLGNLLLENVLYCPNLKFNVISIRTLANKDYECCFTREKAILTREGETYLTAPMVGNLWIYNSVHESKGWLQNGCPHELSKMSEFEKRHEGEFTRDEICEAFQSLTHECELIGPGA